MVWTSRSKIYQTKISTQRFSSGRARFFSLKNDRKRKKNKLRLSKSDHTKQKQNGTDKRINKIVFLLRAFINRSFSSFLTAINAMFVQWSWYFGSYILFTRIRRRTDNFFSFKIKLTIISCQKCLKHEMQSAKHIISPLKIFCLSLPLIHWVESCTADQSIAQYIYRH